VPNHCSGRLNTVSLVAGIVAFSAELRPTVKHTDLQKVHFQPNKPRFPVLLKALSP
jgi:hypothetical protein